MIFPNNFVLYDCFKSLIALWHWAGSSRTSDFLSVPTPVFLLFAAVLLSLSHQKTPRPLCFFPPMSFISNSYLCQYLPVLLFMGWWMERDWMRPRAWPLPSHCLLLLNHHRVWLTFTLMVCPWCLCEWEKEPGTERTKEPPFVLKLLGCLSKSLV